MDGGRERNREIVRGRMDLPTFRQRDSRWVTKYEKQSSANNGCVCVCLHVTVPVHHPSERQRKGVNVPLPN